MSILYLQERIVCRSQAYPEKNPDALVSSSLLTCLFRMQLESFEVPFVQDMKQRHMQCFYILVFTLYSCKQLSLFSVSCLRRQFACFLELVSWASQFYLQGTRLFCDSCRTACSAVHSRNMCVTNRTAKNKWREIERKFKVTERNSILVLKPRSVQL